MGPPAEIGEIPLGIERDLPILQVFQQIELIFVAFFGKIAYRFRLGNLFPLVGRIFLASSAILASN